MREPLVSGFVLALLAVAAGCAGSQTGKSGYVCPVKESESLAISHLKEAYVSLGTLTVEAAERAISLSTDGLSCAPPRGKARAWSIARLLTVRAQAAASLGQVESALVDLDAALLWADQGKRDDPLLLPQIYLGRAVLKMRLGQHAEAAQSAARARTSAERLGKQAALVICEALTLEGDLASRRGRGPKTSEVYFRRVFEIAERYNYPEETWPYMEGAVSRLSVSPEEAKALMGPVPELKRSQLETVAMQAKGGKRSPDAIRFSSGSIDNAEEIVAGMRAGFRGCYSRAFNSGGKSSGRAVLTISVDAGGRVENVSAVSEDMGSFVLDCLMSVARTAQFNPPTTSHAVLIVPVTFIRQE